MLSRAALNGFCKGLPQSTHVVQWGDADVWKIGGKVFAVIGWKDDAPAVSIKVSDLAWEVLGDMPGVRPAPYLASRGMKWMQIYDSTGLPEREIEAHIAASYDMVVLKLTKKLRAELGLPP